MTRFGRAVGILVLGSLVLAGCGGGDTKDASTTAPVDGSTPVGNTVGSADEAAAPADGSCAQVVLAMSKMAGGYSESLAGEASPEFKQWVDSVDTLVAATPSEVRADLTKLAAAYIASAKLRGSNTAGVDPTTAEGAARLAAISEPLNTRDFQQANDRVSAWMDSKCE